MIALICSNCEYEVNYLTAEEGLCQTCWRAYERGREKMGNYFTFTDNTLAVLRNAQIASLDTVTVCTKCGLAFIDGIEGGSDNRFCDKCNESEDK